MPPCSAARALIDSAPATHLPNKQTIQNRSSTSAPLHIKTFPRRQQQTHMQTHVFLCKTYVPAHTSTPAAICRPSLTRSAQNACCRNKIKHVTHSAPLYLLSTPTANSYAYSIFLLHVLYRASSSCSDKNIQLTLYLTAHDESTTCRPETLDTAHISALHLIDHLYEQKSLIFFSLCIQNVPACFIKFFDSHG